MNTLPWLRRILFGLLGAAGLAVYYATRVERASVQLDRFTIEAAEGALPPEGITILHLSDFHFGAGGRMQARKIASLYRALRGQHFDLVAITGDLIHDIGGLPAALDLLGSLQPRLGSFSVPGNHDYCEYSVWGVFAQTAENARGMNPGSRLRQLAAFARKVLCNELVRLPVAYNDASAFTAALEATGITVLLNRAVHVQSEGIDLWLAGVDDLTEGEPDLTQAVSEAPQGALLVLLAHNPDVWLDPLSSRAGLVLCGHTHGGQLRLPLVGAAHTQGTHLSRRRPAGWFERGRSRMFVSRGLGESIPLRFGVRPQAALIRLAPPQPSRDSTLLR